MGELYISAFKPWFHIDNLMLGIPNNVRPNCPKKRKNYLIPEPLCDDLEKFLKFENKRHTSETSFVIEAINNQLYLERNPGLLWNPRKK